MDTQNLLGGAWLVARYGIELVMPLTVRSRVGGRRTTQLADGVKTETFVEGMRPSANLRGHLTFHLKHEVLHLEMLCRLFERVDTMELVAWIDDEPSGQYARKAGFLYEWLTGRQLNVRALMAGPYVDVLDDRKLVAASPDRSVPNRRWRVRDNLPGSPAFCPIVRKTSDFDEAVAVDVQRLLNELALEFGEDVLMRSAVWMTLRESKSSFAIEGEADQSDRIQRFADVLARRTGEGALPLDDASLAQLQSEILGRRTTLQQFGIRQSPVFVGEVVRYQEVVHYVAPPAADMQAMLDGMRVFWDRTYGQSAVMRSAVLAFGFVYIHPLADGNGRVHRFLINDVLRRDGVVQEPMILPVSSLITSDASERRAYDRILDTISRPLMGALAEVYAFSPAQASYADGIRSNFVFKGDAIARPVWRYMDLTRHVVYLADVLARTIRDDMREESRYMRSYAQARAAIKDIVEMPDMQIDRIIRSVEANQGKLSNVLSKEMPLLTEPGIWVAIVQVVAHAFDGLPSGNVAGK
ncbi:Fic family protein [Thauera aromatica]|uniref:Filamentation induced by cAMP protein Fic n=1 Tax=Thauera aromatica K172 TaxID=44139 RepID=A0A2R4BQI9_THAAR|nr:Fic family protein [Thauera aromatica]AVR89472.1 Filamentation induced by cAMP protein Fic [Thauera aromatica K172]